TIRRMRVERRPVKVILTQKTESQLVANGFANTASTREQNLLYTNSVDHCWGMGVAPRWITTTSFETGNINCVLSAKAQSIQRAASGRRQIESCDEGIALCNGDRGGFHSSWNSGKLSYAR